MGVAEVSHRRQTLRNRLRLLPDTFCPLGTADEHTGAQPSAHGCSFLPTRARAARRRARTCSSSA